MANNETDKQSKIIDDNYLKNPNFDFRDEIVEKGKKIIFSISKIYSRI
jgi:hypothetical protein